ncbi:MAG TPA: YHYH protein [Vicinamibacterales bacterium]|nr:YHYH protein [Vicinamibacterales bacterium]
MRHQPIGIAAVALFAAGVLACSKSDASTSSPTAPTSTSTTATTTTTTTTPVTTTPVTTSPTPTTSATSTQAMFSKFAGNGVSVSIDGTTAVIRTSNTPDHKSPYWGTSSANYEAPHSGMQVNPHSIATQNLTFRITTSPAAAASTSDTPLGPIGISVNGVVFYNQYAAGRQPLTSEIVSFDRYNGHPNPNNQYHYHFEPLAITSSSRSRLIGVLLDGFPVYGPIDSDGSTPTNLDGCNGHTAVTADFPSGIYHYHSTSAVPYISGCYRGTAGTVQ